MSPEDTEAKYAELRVNGAITLLPSEVWMTSTLRKFANRQGLKIKQIKQITSTVVYLIHPEHPLEQHAPDHDQSAR